MFNISHCVIPDAHMSPTRCTKRCMIDSDSVESLIDDDTEIEIFTIRRMCRLELHPKRKEKERDDIHGAYSRVSPT